MSDAPRVSPLADGEREAAGHTLARAFRDNPLNVAVIGPDPRRRLRANAYGTRALLPTALAHGRVLAAREGGEPRGVLIATGAFAWPLPPPPALVNLRRVAGQGLRVARRWARVFDALAAVHPQGPHAYLATLGVDPDAQSRGLGTALLAHWLAEVDAEGLPAWLETDREENVGFYRRAGFALAGELRVLGTRVFLMGRSETASAGVTLARHPH